MLSVLPLCSPVLNTSSSAWLIPPQHQQSRHRLTCQRCSHQVDRRQGRKPLNQFRKRSKTIPQCLPKKPVRPQSASPKGSKYPPAPQRNPAYIESCEVFAPEWPARLAPSYTANLCYMCCPSTCMRIRTEQYICDPCLDQKT